VVLFIGIATGITTAQQSPANSNNSSSSEPAPPQLTPRELALSRGDIFMARKEYLEAARTYKDALKGHAKDAVLLNKLGIAYQQLGDVNEADRYYKKAMKADKKFSSAVNNLGTLEYQRHRYGRSIKYYKKALTLNINMASIYSNLGYAYYASKKYPQAMQAFGQALAIDPEVFSRRGGVGPVLQQRSAPDPGMFNFVLAKFYAKSGNAEKAAHYLKISRDFGYKDFRSAEKDPAFAAVIKDPRVREVLFVPPSYANDAGTPAKN
jgi:tetratricopeptide (TPR) repeat protein